MSTSSTTWASSSRWKWIAFAAPYSPGIPHLCLSANSHPPSKGKKISPPSKGKKSHLPPKVGGRRCGNPGIRPLCRGGGQCSGCLVSHNVLETFHPHCGEDQRGHQGLYRFLKEPARIAHLELFLFSPTNFLFCYCYWYCYCYCYCYCGNYLFLSSGRIRVIVIERQSRYSPLGEQSPSVCFEHSSAVINIGLLNIIDIVFSFFHESKSTTKSKIFFCAFANFSKEKGRRTKYLQRFNKKN